MVSHISNNNGVVEFKTALDENDKEIAEITFVDTMTSIENIRLELLSDTLQISYSNGKVGRVKNMFDFTKELEETEKK
jgi:hypothetical protein